MGLDVVEIVLEVEDAFDLEIDAAAWAEIRTVGDLHGYVVAQLQQQDELRQLHPHYPSVPAFLAVRQSLMSLLPVERHQIRPRTELAQIIPQRNRRVAWSCLEELTHIRLPVLRLRRKLRFVVMVIALGTPAVLWGAALWNETPVATLLAIFLPVIVWGLLMLATRVLADVFASDCRTVADVVRRARPPHYPSQRAIVGPVDPDDVWNRVVKIVTEALNVPTDSLTPETRFQEDLRAG